MVTVGLLTLIILGLLAMFTQTQKAFLGSRTQTDVLSAGRATADMLAREVEQVTPNKSSAINLFTAISTNFLKPLYQGLPGSNFRRTNVVEDFYFLSQLNQDWVGTGYRVLSDSPTAGSAGLVGTLYRFTINGRGTSPSAWSWAFTNAPRTNLSIITEGVVHFRVRAFDTNGWLISPVPTNTALGRAATYNWHGSPPLTAPLAAEIDYDFWSNAVPAYLELELGILEPRTLERFRSLPTARSQRDYLSNHVAQVQLFRQRIPIRNVDFSAYQ